MSSKIKTTLTHRDLQPPSGGTNISITTLTNFLPSLQPLLHPIIAPVFPKQPSTSVIYYVHNLHLITNHIDETIAWQLSLIRFSYNPLFSWVSYRLPFCWRRSAPSVSTIPSQFQVGITKRVCQGQHEALGIPNCFHVDVSKCWSPSYKYMTSLPLPWN